MKYFLNCSFCKHKERYNYTKDKERDSCPKCGKEARIEPFYTFNYHCDNCQFDKKILGPKSYDGRKIKCQKCKNLCNLSIASEIIKEETPNKTNTSKEKPRTIKLPVKPSLPRASEDSTECTCPPSDSNHDEINEEKVFEGVIVTIPRGKRFGFIKSKSFSSDVFFNFDDVKDRFEAQPQRDDCVTFQIIKTKKGFSAKKIARKWNYGAVVHLNHEKKFGFLRNGAFKESIHFSFYSLDKRSKKFLNLGSYFKFANTIEQDKGATAHNVSITKKFYGVVQEWRGKFGKILPENSDFLLKVNWTDIVLPQKQGYRELTVGDPVSFLISDSNNQAYCVRKEFSFRKFADLGNENEMLKELSEKALDEEWNFPNKKNSSSLPILWNYLFNTYKRLEDEDLSLEEDQKKIRISKGGDTLVAVFDTGLVNKQYKKIYSVFEENTPNDIGKPKWKLIGFCSRGGTIKNKNYLTLFADLPQRAQYFDDPSDLLYDSNLRLDAVTSHIIGDRVERLPKSILERIPKDMDDPDEILAFLNNYFQMAIQRAQDRILWNYKAAIPQYYPKEKKMQLLLPLCIDDPRKVDVALAVQKEHEAYVGYTILELDWAYSNARLIARPDSEWLTPTQVRDEEEEDS